MLHTNCRSTLYPFSKIARTVVPDSLVPWSVPWPDYNPQFYESDVLKNKPWADPEISDPNFQPKWNSLDGKINRKSYEGDYMICDKYPLNPRGRTGIKGRGVLGKWGPNHAVDPIVSRWKCINNVKELHPITKLPVLQVCVIQRRDTGAWALPGGMVDPGEPVSATLRREFAEEALNSLENGAAASGRLLDTLFSSGHTVYEGYTDDHRNTDSAWIETAAVSFHDDDGSLLGRLPLQAGDDAQAVRWLDVAGGISLSTDHAAFVQRAAELLRAHW